MRERQYTEINGVNYACMPLDGWSGVRLFFEMVGLLGESAMMMITRAFNESDLEDVDAGEVVGAGVYTLLSKLDSDKGVSIMKLVFADVYAVDKSGPEERRIELSNDADFNVHFRGETLRVLRVFAWSMQVNFQSFLDESRLTGFLGTFQAAMKKKAMPTTETESPPTPQQPPPSSSPPSESAPTEAVI